VSSPLLGKIGGYDFFPMMTSNNYPLKGKGMKGSGEHNFGIVFRLAKDRQSPKGTMRSLMMDFCVKLWTVDALQISICFFFVFFFFRHIETWLILNPKTCVYECDFNKRKLNYTKKYLFI
jgi:hypothetical protein